jgi:hypothetical protein
MAVNQLPLAAAMTAAFATLQATITAAGPLANLTLPELAPINAAALAALPPFVTAITALNADIPTSTFAGMVPGAPVSQNVAALQTAASEVSQLAIALNAQAYITRISLNIGNATG